MSTVNNNWNDLKGTFLGVVLGNDFNLMSWDSEGNYHGYDFLKMCWNENQVSLNGKVVPPPGRVVSIAFNPDNDLWIITNSESQDNSIWRMGNDGTWHSYASPGQYKPISIVIGENWKTFLLDANGDVYTIGPLNTWFILPFQDDKSIAVISYKSGLKLWALTKENLVYTYRQGRWTEINTEGIDRPSYISTNINERVLILDQAGVIYNYNDDTKEWDVMDRNAPRLYTIFQYKSELITGLDISTSSTQSGPVWLLGSPIEFKLNSVIQMSALDEKLRTDLKNQPIQTFAKFGVTFPNDQDLQVIEPQDVNLTIALPIRESSKRQLDQEGIDIDVNYAEHNLFTVSVADVSPRFFADTAAFLQEGNLLAHLAPRFGAAIIGSIAQIVQNRLAEQFYGRQNAPDQPDLIVFTCNFVLTALNPGQGINYQFIFDDVGNVF